MAAAADGRAGAPWTDVGAAVIDVLLQAVDAAVAHRRQVVALDGSAVTLFLHGAVAAGSIGLSGAE